MNQQEQAVINLVINGQQAITTFRELNQARAEQLRLVQNLNRNSPDYARQQQRLNDLNGAHRAWRNEIAQGTQALQRQEAAGKGFFASFKDGFAQMAGNITAATMVYKGITSIIGGFQTLWNGSEQAYDEAQRTQTQLQTVLKSTGEVAGIAMGKLQEYQQALMDQTGIDDDVIAKGEEMLLTFTNVRGKIYEDALPAILDMTAALNGGRVTMEGVQATSIQVGKALNDPIVGMAALKKVGVTLDEQQKEQIRTMVKGNDVMGAQAVILKELQKEFGGTAKAIADTDVGKLQKFETAYGNLQERIGEGITRGKSALAAFFLPLVEYLGSAKTKSEELTEEFRSQSDKVDTLQKSTVPLLDRYDQLKTKGNLNKIEQTELNGIIAQISGTIPGAVTQWDRYGNALGINTEKARDFIKVQKALLAYQNKEAIAETKDSLDQLIKNQEAVQRTLNRGEVSASGGGMASNQMRRMTESEIQASVAQLKSLGEQIVAQQLLLKGLTGGGFEAPGKTTFTAPQGGPSQADKDAAARKAEQMARERAETVKGLAALAQDYESFEVAQLVNTASANEKEVQALEDSFNKQIEKQREGLSKKRITEEEAAAIHRRMQSLAAERDQAHDQLRLKQEADLVNDIAQFNESLTDKLKTEYSKQVESINAAYDARLAKVGSSLPMIEMVEKGRAEALAQAKINQEHRFQDEKEKIAAEGAALDVANDGSELARINAKYDAEIEALREKYDEELLMEGEFQAAIDAINGNREKDLGKSEAAKKKQESKERKDAELQAASDVANAIFTISERNRQAETEAELKKLNDRKEIELSNKNLTEAQKKAIDAKYAKEEAAIKLKAWKAQRDADLQSAVINGALAVVKALPNFVLAAAAGVAAGAQIAVIAAQKPPQFAKGGILPGPSHGQGGMNLVGAYGQVYGNVEGGEALLSKEAYANNRSVVDALLNGGGGRLNYDRVIEATTSREQRRTFNTSATAAPVAGSSVAVPGTATAGSDRLDRVEQLLANFIEKQARINAVPVILSRRVQDQEDARVVKISDEANA